jgi:hypothetical protein
MRIELGFTANQQRKQKSATYIVQIFIIIRLLFRSIGSGLDLTELLFFARFRLLSLQTGDLLFNPPLNHMTHP